MLEIIKEALHLLSNFFGSNPPDVIKGILSVSYFFAIIGFVILVFFFLIATPIYLRRIAVAIERKNSLNNQHPQHIPAPTNPNTPLNTQPQVIPKKKNVFTTDMSELFKKK